MHRIDAGHGSLFSVDQIYFLCLFQNVNFINIPNSLFLENEQKNYCLKIYKFHFELEMRSGELSIFIPADRKAKTFKVKTSHHENPKFL